MLDLAFAADMAGYFHVVRRVRDAHLGNVLAHEITIRGHIKCITADDSMLAQMPDVVFARDQCLVDDIFRFNVVFVVCMRIYQSIKQQINFSSTFTTVQGGQISEVKIAPNYSRITQSAGIEALKQEESTNASLGFTLKPLPELSVTVDAYQVKVKDRVVLSGQFSADDPSLDPAFTSTLQSLDVSLAQFFVNAVNTTNMGVDLVFDYNKKVSEKEHLRFLLTANIQDMTIDKINVPAKLGNNEQAFLSDREQTFILASAPNTKAALSVEYGLKKFTFGARFNYFGEVTLLGYGEDGLGINPTVPKDDGSGSVKDEYTYGGKLVPDLYLGWKICKSASLHIGADNFLNVHPDLGFVKGAAGWAFNNETGGPWDAVQMGGNGMRLFTRVTMNF